MATHKLINNDMKSYGIPGLGSKDNKPSDTIKSSTKIKTQEERIEALEKKVKELENKLSYMNIMI